MQFKKSDSETEVITNIIKYFHSSTTILLSIVHFCYVEFFSSNGFYVINDKN